MKILIITQARTGSTRLPGKVLKQIGDKTLLDIHLERLQKSKLATKVLLATTVEPGDEAICQVGERHGLACYRGSEQDVLDRYYQTAVAYQPDYVVRVTSDCPLVDPELIDKVITFALEQGAHYASNVLEDKYFPDGQDIEVFRFSELAEAWEKATLRSDREHVTPYIRKKLFEQAPEKIQSYTNQEELGFLRMTVDEPADYEVIKALVSRLGDDKGWLEYARLLQEDESIQGLNAAIKRNEGYKTSINNENGK